MVQSSYNRPSPPRSSTSRPLISWLRRANASFRPEPSGPGWPATSCWRSRSPVSRATSASTHSFSSRWCRSWVRSSGRSRQVLATGPIMPRSEEHTSELQSHHDLVCRLLLEKKKKKTIKRKKKKKKKKKIKNKKKYKKK